MKIDRELIPFLFLILMVMSFLGAFLITNAVLLLCGGLFFVAFIGSTVLLDAMS